jgi:hypothetical protein
LDWIGLDWVRWALNLGSDWIGLDFVGLLHSYTRLDWSGMDQWVLVWPGWWKWKWSLQRYDSETMTHTDQTKPSPVKSSQVEGSQWQYTPIQHNPIQSSRADVKSNYIKPEGYADILHSPSSYPPPTPLSREIIPIKKRTNKSPGP